MRRGWGKSRRRREPLGDRACEATTQYGVRCKIKKEPGSNHCHVHQFVVEGHTPTDSERLDWLTRHGKGRGTWRCVFNVERGRRDPQVILVCDGLFKAGNRDSPRKAIDLAMRKELEK